MQVLNTWTLRLAMMLIIAVPMIFSLASAYGLLWYDHRNASALLTVGAAILLLALIEAFWSVRKRHPRDRKWGDAIVLGICLLIILGALALHAKPLLQAGYLLTGVFSFGFSMAMTGSFQSFWRYPTWRQLGRQIFT